MVSIVLAAMVRPEKVRGPRAARLVNWRVTGWVMVQLAKVCAGREVRSKRGWWRLEAHGGIEWQVDCGECEGLQLVRDVDRRASRRTRRSSGCGFMICVGWFGCWIDDEIENS